MFYELFLDEVMVKRKYYKKTNNNQVREHFKTVL